ncbi:MAG: putative 4-hydroxy-4-methyl-2-oxoglutarate aldolase, partial [Aeromonas sp.]|nr:putative 4-hydroxy-4-methyl-2-oxoglutarate aldolase [Aeromonas sp.]
MLDLLPDLCDQHGDALQVADPLFHDFGGKPLFYGQAVTLSCYE